MDDFECFFLSFSGIDTRDICDMARRIADSTLLGRELPQAEFDEIVSRLTLPSQVTYFLERLLGFFEDAFLSSSIDGRRAEKLERTVSKCRGGGAL